MSTTRCQARDRVPLPNSRQVTREGFLIAPAKINRTGIQIYRARELGLDGGDRPIRLFRPAEEVFAAATLASFEGGTLTDDHPQDDVSSANWSQLARGDIRDVCAAGDYTSAKIIVRDEAMIEKVRAGRAELSCGYSFDLDLTPGTTARGEKYDGRQTNIIGNHLAIVDRGRAGPGVRIADRDPPHEGSSDNMRDIEQEFIEERTNAIEARARDLRAYAAATVADADEPPTVRQRWIAREAAGSRHRATAAATTDDDADADGDDSATTGDTRADYLARQSALSRKPATGSGGWR